MIYLIIVTIYNNVADTAFFRPVLIFDVCSSEKFFNFTNRSKSTSRCLNPGPVNYCHNIINRLLQKFRTPVHHLTSKSKVTISHYAKENNNVPLYTCTYIIFTASLTEST